MAQKVNALAERELTYHMPRQDHQVRVMMSKHGFKQAPLEKANIILFTGGADINPYFYGEKRLKTTGVSMACDYADMRALKHSSVYQFKAGICRGGQFLNVVFGGRLYQHVTDHAIYGTHAAYHQDDKDPHVIQVTSTHHQMMIPSEDATVVYATNLAKRKFTDTTEEIYQDDERPKLFDDAEVVLYPKSGVLCFQPHPEYEQMGNIACTEAFFRLIKDHMLSDKGASLMAYRKAAGGAAD